jgi:hypothetical protein
MDEKSQAGISVFTFPVAKWTEFVESGAVVKLYCKFYRHKKSLLEDICNPLLYVPSDAEWRRA